VFDIQQNWTLKTALNEAKKYKTRKEFRKLKPDWFKKK